MSDDPKMVAEMMAARELATVCVSLTTPTQLNVLVALLNGWEYRPSDQSWACTKGGVPAHSKNCPNYVVDAEFILGLIKGQKIGVGVYSTGEWHASTGHRAAVGKTLEEAVLRCYVRHVQCQESDDVAIPKDFT